MKGFVKIIIIGAVIIGIGLAVLLVALGLNGWSFTPDFKIEEFTSEAENTALSVGLDAGKLKIEYHDEACVKIFYPVARGYETKIREEGGKLSFEGNKRRWFAFSWGVTVPETIVKIPRDKITDVDIELNAGSVELADGAFESVTVKINAGACTVGEIANCKTMNLRLNAGSLNVKGAQCEKLKCVVNAGSARIQKIDGAESEVEVHAGTANLAFQGSVEDYSATVSVSAGSCNGLSAREGGERRISVKVSAGSVNVSFQG